MDLARRKKTMEVVVDEEEGVLFEVQTLTVAETADLMAQRVKLDLDDETGDELDEGKVPTSVELRMPYGELVRLFPKKVVRAENLTVEGVDFDPRIREHVESLPSAWVIKVMSQLLTYATTMSKETVKN